MVFDDKYLSFDNSSFFKHGGWSSFYPEEVEPIPTNSPVERGNPVIMSCFVDADHARCNMNRRSHMGILIFVNRSPTVFFSKFQNTVKLSKFGPEFIAMKQSVELI